MKLNVLAMPRTLRARLMLFIVPLVCLSNFTAGYFLIQSGKESILAEKRHYLFAATHILRDHLAQRGGFANLRGEPASPAEDIHRLNLALAEFTESIARAFPGIGVGYYHRELDAILTYGPQAEYGATIGKAIAPTHRGRQVMASGQPAVESGLQVRGNIMNAMTPIFEEERVVGYVWANELIDDIDQQLADMRNTVLLLGILVLFFSLFIVYWVVARLTRDVSTIKRGLVEIENDLGRRIPPMYGEIGDIAQAINSMAQSLFTSRQKEREQAAAALRQQEDTLRTAIEAIDEAFVLYDPDDRLVYCNEKYLAMFPQVADLMVPGNTFEYIVRALSERGLYPQPAESREEWIRERIEQHRNGTSNFELRIDADHWLQIVDRKTQTGHIVGFRVDISNLKRAMEAAEAANRLLTELASRDSLTGLLNRRYMDLQVDSAWDDATRRENSFALLLIDVDHFKNFNDRHGHQAGDDCLRQVAALMAAIVDRYNAARSDRPAFVARYGGEEFVVVLPQVTRADYEEIAQDIVTAMRRAALPHQDNADWGIVTVSIGGAYLEPARNGLSALFRTADLQLYRAKKNGRNRAEPGYIEG